MSGFYDFRTTNQRNLAAKRQAPIYRIGHAAATEISATATPLWGGSAVHPNHGERRLAQAVILLAIMDLRSKDRDERDSARAFFRDLPGLDKWAFRAGSSRERVFSAVRLERPLVARALRRVMGGHYA